MERKLKIDRIPAGAGVEIGRGLCGHVSLRRLCGDVRNEFGGKTEPLGSNKPNDCEHRRKAQRVRLFLSRVFPPGLHSCVPVFILCRLLGSTSALSISFHTVDSGTSDGAVALT